MESEFRNPDGASMLPHCRPNVAPMLPHCWLSVTAQISNALIISFLSGAFFGILLVQTWLARVGRRSSSSLCCPQCPQCGHIVAPMWPQCCPKAAPCFPQGCPNFAPMWQKCCPNVAPMLPHCCPNVASMLPQCCPNVAPMWPQCCPYGAPMLPPSGGSIHFVGRPQTKNQKLSKNTKNWNHQCSGNVCAPMWP